jgi:hypothetical protein
MTPDQLKPGIVVTGPIFSESVKILTSFPLGSKWKLVGQGLRTNQVHDRVLTLTDLAQLEASPDSEPFDGDPHQFRLAVEAIRLGLAYEHDPYFSLSIARVDPLPHQLEAVYDYFLKQPRIRFLLADDPGAGKTIMAGLLIKELRIRGLVKRILIVTPAALTFQWQREMKDNFGTHNALEGLAKKELNLGAIIGKSAEARERRLVPEVIEDFFQGAAPIAGLNPKAGRGRPSIFTVGRIPRNLWATGERLVDERAQHLWKVDKVNLPKTETPPKKGRKAKGDVPGQLSLFNLVPGDKPAPTSEVEEVIKKVELKAGLTTLDRLHQAMLLFGAGRGEALNASWSRTGGRQGRTLLETRQRLATALPPGHR